MLLIGYFAGSYSSGFLRPRRLDFAILLFLIGAKMIKEGLERKKNTEVKQILLEITLYYPYQRALMPWQQDLHFLLLTLTGLLLLFVLGSLFSI